MTELTSVYRLSFWTMRRGEVDDEWVKHFTSLEKAQKAASDHFQDELTWKLYPLSKDYEARPNARYETHYVINEIEIEA